MISFKEDLYIMVNLEPFGKSSSIFSSILPSHHARPTLLLLDPSLPGLLSSRPYWRTFLPHSKTSTFSGKELTHPRSYSAISEALFATSDTLLAPSSPSKPRHSCINEILQAPTVTLSAVARFFFLRDKCTHVPIYTVTFEGTAQKRMSNERDQC